MGRIKVLPPQEVQKIAAGEVVERPASVAKELIENALDAGATTLTLSLEEGGKKCIQLTDNGCGMDAEDARACIINHATSKISSVNELSSLSSFGFRGEALASIAAVSHFNLTTKTEASFEGLLLIVEQGEIIEQKTVSANTGTTIEVRDLFYNVPARQKFLKKRDTEWRTIHHLFTAYALAHHTKTFSLYHEGQSVLYCPAAKTLQERFTQLFDTSWLEQIIPIKAAEGNYMLEGVISRPQRTRYDKSHIFAFVNQRWIKNHKLIQALIKGYDNILPAQQYPIGTFLLNINQDEVDINVHPRKEEVQFLKPLLVERFIEDSVRKALTGSIKQTFGGASQSYEQSRTAFQMEAAADPAPSIHFFSEKTLKVNGIQSEDTDIFWARKGSTRTDAENLPACCTHKTAHNPGAQTIVHKQLNMIAEHEKHQYILLGQLMNTYLLIENKEGLWLIDQHAAHERILYEQFEKRFSELEPITLLFPQLITLTSEELDVLGPYLHLFNEYGIELEIFGEQQITIRAIPAPLKNINLTSVLKITAAWVREENQLCKNSLEEPLSKKLRAIMACKAAIKAGDKLSEQEMHELIKKLAISNYNTTCPHGRPTSWRFTSYDLEKYFQRCD